MNEEHDKFLCEKYPKLFANRHKSMQETAMCWGFECGDGWFNLINTLCYSIQRYIDQTGAPQVVVDQVKEKFGTLRFYVTGGDDNTDGMITLAENISGKICEVCGSPGTTGGKGWVRTLCDTHRNE